jgi:hypothetical protein
MIPHTADAQLAAAASCADCGAAVSGNFCSSCGADLRESALSFLGRSAAPVRRSFPAVYAKILRAPVRQTVAFAEDPSYRGHVSFALAGIALYLLIIVPIVVRQVAPEGAQVSESMLTLMKVLSQAGVYVGILIAFLMAFFAFRTFASDKRPFHQYFKLNCLALGFVSPIYAIYEFVTRNLLHGVGLSAIEMQQLPTDGIHPTMFVSLAVFVLLLSYFIGINRRFWRMPLWKVVLIYMPTYYVSGIVSYQLMWYVGWYTAYLLSAAGVVS